GPAASWASKPTRRGALVEVPEGQMVRAGIERGADGEVGLAQFGGHARREGRVDDDLVAVALPAAADAAARRVVRRAGRLEVAHRVRLEDHLAPCGGAHGVGCGRDAGEVAV